MDLFLWSGIIFVFGQVATLYVAFRQKQYLEATQTTLPEASLGVALIYFFGVIILFGLVLFFIPIAKIKVILKALFTFLYAWGVFIVLALSLPVPAAGILALIGGVAWYLSPRVWLHNLLLILTLTGAGAVFGFVLPPWTVVALLAILSIYDILAVRFGYMIWLAKRLSEVDVLPAFIIPKKASGWGLNLKTEFKKLIAGEPAAEREFSILGGGDLGFPLLLISSVFFTQGLIQSIVVAAFALLGLVSAYIIHLVFLKGRPMPALPPISFFCIAGFLIAYFLL